jgi:hypothetical protein
MFKIIAVAIAAMLVVVPGITTGIAASSEGKVKHEDKEDKHVVDKKTAFPKHDWNIRYEDRQIAGRDETIERLRSKGRIKDTDVLIIISHEVKQINE